MKNRFCIIIFTLILTGTFLLSGVNSVNGQTATQPVQQTAVVKQSKVQPVQLRKTGVQHPLVQEKAPVLVEPANGRTLTKYPRETKFEWRAVAGAKSYTLDVEYNDGQWKELKLVKVEGLTATVDFIGDNPGRWRVRAIYEGDKEGPWSPMWGFKYKTPQSGNAGAKAIPKPNTGTETKPNTGQKATSELMTAPELVAPIAGATLSNIPRIIEYSWRKVEGANSYEIQIQYNDGAWKNLKVQNVGSILIYKHTFVGANPGRWRVRAFASGKPGRFSEWREFKYTR